MISEKGGQCGYVIFNSEKIGQIKSNMIDKVSDEFSDEFDKLLAI